MVPIPELSAVTSLWIRQRKDTAELFGVEKRDTYSLETDDNRQIAFASEHHHRYIGKALLRVLFGRWRPFEVTLFDEFKTPVLVAKHPFRFYFQQLTIMLPDGRVIGHVKRRFGLFSKRFDIIDAQEFILYSTSAPAWKIRSFIIRRNGKEQAIIRRRWSGEIRKKITRADKFQIEFMGPFTPHDHRLLILMAALFVQLIFFERPRKKE